MYSRLVDRHRQANCITLSGRCMRDLGIANVGIGEEGVHRPGEGTGMQEGYLLDARVRRGSTEMWARCQKSCLCRCICKSIL